MHRSAYITFVFLAKICLQLQFDGTVSFNFQGEFLRTGYVFHHSRLGSSSPNKWKIESGIFELSSEGRGSGSREEAKSNVEEQLITCKYKRMINRYFLCLTEMRLWFEKIVLLLTPPGGCNKYKKKRNIIHWKYQMYYISQQSPFVRCFLLLHTLRCKVWLRIGPNRCTRCASACNKVSYDCIAFLWAISTTKV